MDPDAILDDEVNMKSAPRNFPDHILQDRLFFPVSVKRSVKWWSALLKKVERLSPETSYGRNQRSVSINFMNRTEAYLSAELDWEQFDLVTTSVSFCWMSTTTHKRLRSWPFWEPIPVCWSRCSKWSPGNFWWHCQNCTCRQRTGKRAKIPVYSTDDEVDPVGACVGMRERVQTIVNELHGEKIDIVRYSEKSKPTPVTPSPRRKSKVWKSMRKTKKLMLL